MLSYLRRRNNSLNGSQCCIDFGSRVHVGVKVVLTLEGAVQAKMGWLRGWTGGTRGEGDAGNWPADTDEA